MAGTVEKPLSPGQLQLYSHYSPALTPGTYSITLNQKFHTDSQSVKDNLTTTKSFEVVAPSLHLNNADIHSIYPPPGSAQECRVLPHIAFNDPHLPWEKQSWAQGQNDQSKIPWLALLVFDEDELRLTPKILEEWKNLIGEVKPGTNGIQRQAPVQSRTMSLSMTPNQLSALHNAGKVQAAMVDKSDKEIIEAIFVPMELFRSYFGVLNSSSTGWDIPSDGTPVLDRYQYLSHVRKVNMHGHQADGIADEEGHFSVCVAHRTGPTNAKTPRAMVAHLLSLDLKDVKMSNSPSVVGMVSLYSWNYVCIPSEETQIITSTFESLVKSVSPLRYHEEDIQALQSDSSDAAAWLKSRLTEGYSFLRYIPQTGETTAAIHRGVLSPIRLTSMEWPQSNDGTDLQILDKRTGFMDLTYSAAWSLGRSLAIADKSFMEAIIRLRGEIFMGALEAAKKASDPQYISRSDLIQKSLEIANGLAHDIEKNVLREKGLYNRWLNAISHDASALSPRENASWVNPVLRGHFASNLKGVVGIIAGTSRGSSFTDDNPAQSTSWNTVLAWVMSKLALSGLPPSYLLPDPNMLPLESIRTFYVDDSWLDCFIDGALSIGNHFDRDDGSRREIKENVNEYLKQPQGNPPKRPQIPRWGLFIRSKLIKANADLKIEASPLTGQNPDDRPVLLTRKLVADDTLMVMFNKYPEDTVAQWELHISQAGHQQQFAAARQLNSEDLKFNFCPVYTSEPSSGRKYVGFGASWDKSRSTGRLDGDDHDALPSIYEWNSRILLIQNFARVCTQVLGSKMVEGFDKNTVASSALTGIQLNDPLLKWTLGTAEARKNNSGIEATPERLLYVPASTIVRPPAIRASLAVAASEPSFVRKPDSSFNPVLPSVGKLGPAIVVKNDSIGTLPPTGMPVSLWEWSTWPLLTFGKATPADWKDPIDLVWSIKATSAMLKPKGSLDPSWEYFKSTWKPLRIMLSIPVGLASSDLYDESDCQFLPTIRMLDKSMGWSGSIALSQDRKAIVVKLVPRMLGLDFAVLGDPSFMMCSVGKIPAAGIVTVRIKEEVYDGHDLNSFMYSLSTFGIVKEDVGPSGRWP